MASLTNPLATGGLLIMSYFMGSIPFGLLIARLFYKLDIRQHGSGNPGATNVWRVLGPKPGVPTLLLDIAKGAIPVLITRSFQPPTSVWPILAGLLAIIGHNWSCFLKFKGGKGVATSTGVFLALIPLHTLCAVAGFLVVFFILQRVSLGSIAGALVLFLSTFIFPVDKLHRIVILTAALMIILKHIPNMKRLAQGTEPKVRFKK